MTTTKLTPFYNRASKAATLQTTFVLETAFITPLVSGYIADEKGQLVKLGRLRWFTTPILMMTVL